MLRFEGSVDTRFTADSCNETRPDLANQFQVQHSFIKSIKSARHSQKTRLVIKLGCQNIRLNQPESYVTVAVISTINQITTSVFVPLTFGIN